MVDHEIDGDQRLHPRDVTTAARHRRAHRREVDEQRHAREVLQQHAADDEGHFRRARGARLPPRERFDVLVADAPAVEIAQHRLEEDAEAHRQPRDARDPSLLEQRERVVGAGCSGGEAQRLANVDHGSDFVIATDRVPSSGCRRPAAA